MNKKIKDDISEYLFSDKTNGRKKMDKLWKNKLCHYCGKTILTDKDYGGSEPADAKVGMPLSAYKRLMKKNWKYFHYFCYQKTNKEFFKSLFKTAKEYAKKQFNSQPFRLYCSEEPNIDIYAGKGWFVLRYGSISISSKQKEWERLKKEILAIRKTKNTFSYDIFVKTSKSQYVFMSIKDRELDKLKEAIRFSGYREKYLAKL